jgi:hypothetical protein
MNTIILLTILLMIIVDWWLFFYLANRKWRTIDTGLLISVSVILIPVTWYMTYVFTYMYDENTRFIGAPMMAAAFQRSTADGKWADFVGAGVIVAPIVNFIIYLSCYAAIWTIISFSRKNAR